MGASADKLRRASEIKTEFSRRVSAALGDMILALLECGIDVPRADLRAFHDSLQGALGDVAYDAIVELETEASYESLAEDNADLADYHARANRPAAAE